MEGILEFFIKNGALGLFILSFAEATFFPIPPDFVLLPLSLLRPQSALYYAAVTSLASTLGGVFGYLIGMRAGRPVLSRWVKGDNFSKIEETFTRYGGWAVAVAGFTPLPYKVFTIASGVFGIKMSTFVVASLLSRSARFMLEGVTVMAVGERALEYIDRWLGPGSFILMGLAVILYFLAKKILQYIKAAPSSGTQVSLKARAQSWVKLYGEFGIYMLAGFCMASILGAAFFKLAADLLSQELETFDVNVVSLINAMGSPVLEYLATGIDFLSQWYLLTIIILLGVLGSGVIGGKRIYSIISSLTLVGSIALQWGLKSVFQRPRIEPTSPLLDFLAFSFPSGLILLITAFVGYVVYLKARKNYGLKRWGFIISWLLIIMLAGASRIYEEISYPSDVLAGFIIGWVWLILCVLATKALEHYKIS